MWDIWCKALGTKAYNDNDKADRVALIRTGWVLLHIITCFAIVSKCNTKSWTKVTWIMINR